jgi:protein subunit release factor A
MYNDGKEVCITKNSQVMEQMELLSKEIGIAHSRIEELEERLHSVLVPEESSDNNPEPD